MTREHHDWKPGAAPPPIRPHSLAKHRVLRAYLERYVSVLTKTLAQDQFRVTLVDGFAGGGRYTDSKTNEERPGSPLIMLEAMRQAALAAQQRRTKPFHLDVEYIFVEKDPHAFSFLRDTLAHSDFAHLLDDRIHLINGDFVDQIPKITEFVKGRGSAERVIFALDQFGYSEVPLPTIRGILASLANAEVILTFATDFLIDYLSDGEQSRRILEKVGLPSSIVTAKDAVDWRRHIQFELHQEIPQRTGAQFYTPFFIRSEDSHRDFWLIHLSGHFRARDVMVGLHWQENTSFAHYGGAGLQMLGYDQRRDEQLTRQRVLPGFFFDQNALQASHSELLSNMPERIFRFGEGIEFASLFASLTNECPVTLEIMEGVLNELAREGVIEVRDKSGTISRRAGIQHPTDIIIRNPQKRIVFP